MESNTIFGLGLKVLEFGNIVPKPKGFEN